MALRVPQDTSPATVKYRYRVKNWPEYDRALVNRGSLTVWFDADSLRKDWTPEPSGKRGKPMKYSWIAIQTALTLKGVFRLPYRATEGLLRSLMRLTGVDLPVPDHSYLSRRAVGLDVAIPRRARIAPMHVVVDSTGVKVYGEGEWKVRQHGVSKRRTWRKIHLAVDASVNDIVAVEVTTANVGDSEVFEGLMEQIDDPIEQVSGDGAYDTQGVHAAIMAREANATIPPREGAIRWGNAHPRDRIVEAIDTQGRATWKTTSGYHRRSLAETMMYRFKQLGDRLFSRTFERQVVEVHVRVAILNVFAYLGLPLSVKSGIIPSVA